jgi:hypothetical protein
MGVPIEMLSARGEVFFGIAWNVGLDVRSTVPQACQCCLEIVR